MSFWAEISRQEIFAVREQTLSVGGAVLHLKGSDKGIMP